jgi:predicted glycosyltransferase
LNYKNKVLIDIPHPHFVHFYKNVISSLGAEHVVITCQNTAIVRYLLDNYHLQYFVIGDKGNKIFGKILKHIEYFFKYLIILRKYKVSVVVGTASGLLIASKLLNIKSVYFDDDDSAVQGMVIKFNVKLASYVITPKCLEFEGYGKKHFVYRGYQELAYLAPKYFSPNVSTLHKYSLQPYKYALLRMNDFHAYHDISHTGISNEVKNSIVSLLEQQGLCVLISSESNLDIQYSKYQIKIDPIDIFDIMNFAYVYIGDSQTMASEAAVLGVPSIRCNTFKDKISYLKELEITYSLTKAFRPDEDKDMLVYLKRIITNPNIRDEWEKKREFMLSQMEDVNAYILNFLETNLFHK